MPGVWPQPGFCTEPKSLSLRYRFHDTKQRYFPKCKSWLFVRSLSSLLSHTIHLLASEEDRLRASFLTSSRAQDTARQCCWTACRQKATACVYLSWGAQGGCALLSSALWEWQWRWSHLHVFSRLSILSRAREAETENTSSAECLDPTAEHLWYCWRAGVSARCKYFRFLSYKKGSWKSGAMMKHEGIALWPGDLQIKLLKHFFKANLSPISVSMLHMRKIPSRQTQSLSEVGWQGCSRVTSGGISGRRMERRRAK